MKLLGSIAELVKTVFRANNQQIELKPNTSTTYTATRTVQLPEGDANHVLVSRDSTDTLTSKTISGASNTLTVRLANDVTGTLPIANGGTGQTAQTAAFDALSPNTTKGDLTAHNGTNNVRVAAGSDGTVLTADAASAAGVKWTSPLTNPMTASGDIIVGGASGAATRLAVGSDGDVLKVVSGTPTWLTGMSAITGQAATGLTDGTTTTIGSSTLSLPAGTYLMEFGVRSRITTSATPSSALVIVQVADSSNTSLTSTGASGLTLYTANDYRTSISGMDTVTLASTTTIKLRAQISVSGGTVTTRDIALGYVKATRIS